MKSPQILKTLHSFGFYWQQQNVFKQILFQFFSTLLQIGLILYFYYHLPPQVPLFMSRSWGTLRLASTATLFLLPVSCLTVSVLNTFLSFLAHKTSPWLSKTLMVVSNIFCIVTLFTLGKILLLSL